MVGDKDRELSEEELGEVSGGNRDDGRTNAPAVGCGQSGDNREDDSANENADGAPGRHSGQVVPPDPF